MTMMEFQKPIPVVTPLGDGYAIYVTSYGMFEDDEWCVALTVDGQIRHFTSSQIKLWQNQTYGIFKKES